MMDDHKKIQKRGLARIRTGVAGIKNQSANPYTTRPVRAFCRQIGIKAHARIWLRNDASCPFRKLYVEFNHLQIMIDSELFLSIWWLFKIVSCLY